MRGGRAMYLVNGRELDIVIEDGKPRITCLDGTTRHGDLMVVAKGAYGVPSLWYARCSNCGVEVQVPEGYGDLSVPIYPRGLA